ncbi:MAG: TRAP transporter small permease subunit [Burkholderiales bacterium]|nr:TRAP transporter small permease subunit [Burkholderiales bacterium]
MVNRFIYGIDQLSKSVGHAFAWCIVILTIGTCYEVIVRYALNAPTSWAFDMSYLMYGAVFFMAGAYTLSRGGHVRADMFYRLWPVRVQAAVEAALYVLFFFPGVTALVISGWGYGTSSMRIFEVSVNSPAGVPIWPLKMMIPIGAALLTLQGLAEVLRCFQCMRDGRWPPRLHDVEELENQILRQAQAGKVDVRAITGETK